MKFLVAGLISVFAMSNSIAGESIFGGGSFISESSQSSGDNYVKYDLARVVRLQPITTSKVYSVIRQSCTQLKTYLYHLQSLVVLLVRVSLK